MGIKWNDRIKFTVLVFLLTIGITGVLTGIKHGDTYLRSDYFESGRFGHQVDAYLHLISLELIDKDEMKDAIKVTEDEIEKYRLRYGSLAEQISSIKNQYETKIEQAKSADDEKLAEYFINERDQKINDITKNFKSDEYVRNKIIKEREQEIDEFFDYVRGFYGEDESLQTAFSYYIKETKTGEVHTDTEISDEQYVEETFNDGAMVYVRNFSNLYVLDEAADFKDGSIKKLIEETTDGFEGYIGVPKSKSSSNIILTAIHDYELKRIAALVYVIVGLIALVLAFIQYKKTNVRYMFNTEKFQPTFNRIPIDVSIFFTFFIGVITLTHLLNGLDIDYITYPLLPIIWDLIFFDLIPKAVLLTVTFFLGKMLYSRIGNPNLLNEEWKSSLLVKLFNGLQMAFLNRKNGTQLVVLLIVLFCWGAGTVLTMIYPPLLLLYIPASALIGIPVLILLFRKVGYFNQIAHHVKLLANGNLEKEMPIKGKSVLAELAADLNSLKRGVKVSQNEQAKSERLKTELITNVSHDLRTPLTSIITYTELLKQPNLTSEDRDSYVDIIDRKSQRLKVLIDDLFEASKMASGNVELVKERVDIVQLLQQALAEYSEVINESSLQFRITNPDDPVYAVVDGQKLWRVFDNLIGNILKYSLENTRVYIGVKMQNGRAVIAFKNISKYELSEDIDELFERFKRGDESRHTDGSGLGLAIAKSIVDLHDGGLDIEVDGDLFKVTMTIQTAA